MEWVNSGVQVMNMRSCDAVFRRIADSGLVGIIRWHEGAVLSDIARSLYDGGVTALEITLNSSDGLEGIASVRRLIDGTDKLIGAGSVTSVDAVRCAVEAGSQFIVSPTFKPEVVAAAQGAGVSVFPGALTPGEVQSAWESGAQMVKVFPASCFGPGYIRELLAPLSYIKLMPTGGVRMDNIAAYFQAGATCLAMGGTLVHAEYITRRDWSGLTEHAVQFVRAIRNCKSAG